MSTLLQCGNHIASARKLTFQKLRALQNAFDTSLHKSYNEVSKEAMLLKAKESETPDDQRPTSSQNDQIVFVDKGIKAFNMKEVKELVELDTQLRNVKFKLVTNNTELNESSINPNFRRLLNNGLYYGIYMNSTQQSAKYLESLSGEENLKKIPTQVYLSETSEHRSDRDGPKFLEVPNHQTFRIPFKAGKKEYHLQIPSISLIVKTQGIGIPANHPDLSILLELDTIPNPFIDGKDLKFHEIEEAENLDLVALIPTHILSHQKYIPVRKEITPGLVFHQGKLYKYSELSSLLAKELKVKPSFFEVVPFIVHKRSLNDTELTVTVNNKEVLNRDKFPNLGTTPDAPIGVWTNRGSFTPLVAIPNTYVAKCIDFKKTYERQILSQSDVVINSDILRSVILENDTTSNFLFTDRENTLNMLTGVFEIVRSRYDLNATKFVWNLNELLIEEDGNFHDYTLLRQFHRLCQDKIQLGDFSVSLLEYVTTDNLLRAVEESSERVPNPLLINVILRLLHDQLRYHFPEFSGYYLETLNLKDVSTIIPETEPPSSEQELNKWQNYIRYPIIPLSYSVSAKSLTEGIFDNIPTLITQLHSVKQLPAPYTIKFKFKSPPQFSIVNVLDVINRAAVKISGSTIILNPGSAVRRHLITVDEVYREPHTVVQSVLSFKAYSDPDAWVARLKPMKFLEQNPELATGEEGEVDVELFQEKFREYLLVDVRENIASAIRDEASLTENQVHAKIQKLEKYVDGVSKLILKRFIVNFIELYNQSEPTAEGLEEIDDADSKINEFKKLL